MCCLRDVLIFSHRKMKAKEGKKTKDMQCKQQA